MNDSHIIVGNLYRNVLVNRQELFLCLEKSYHVHNKIALHLVLNLKTLMKEALLSDEMIPWDEKP